MGILDTIAKEVAEETTVNSGNSTEETTTEPVAETPNTEAETPASENVNPATVDSTENNAAETNNSAPEVPVVEPETTQNLFANDEIARINDFVKRTGKGLDDYKALATPTDELDPKELLRQYYSEKERLGEKQMALKFKTFDLAQETDDDDDDFGEDNSDEKLKAEAEIEADLKNAREWREGFVKEMLSSPAQPAETAQSELDIQTLATQFQKEFEQQQQKSADEYRQTMYKVLPEITEIPLDVLDQKISFVPDEDFGKNLRLVSEDLSVAVNPFFENGKVSKPKELALEAAWAYEPTRNAMLKFIVDEAVKMDRISQMKQRRNVGPDTYQNQATGADTDAEAEFDKFRAARKS